ncbi:Mac1p KNAG_0M02140 [Huiozyma naganishii CBS 8797]|uniref:Copper-fist domain-containing protein n=1 Tax=Huiozyma naganishii (strain ATCC MYA-139 / BCRC 22969 / CBS 8797 / KCTC 17520 / NBRC 10181 / NCYC 3082 / Yp74L-3) TaxID=1071383 RepID=J7S496_HUIN7|nr:hypothetical protein KNAG_0M02140 [Kazachstania naganishii CBS 8797]CCK73067.1 hypothetical protein KNAG_0M02140 [Kazachstania naganishii CBS 8797]
MIIYNGDKYACVSCIRGHRSSQCRHTARMLVKVRTRGRPSPIDIRDCIMVDVTSRVGGKHGGLGCGGGVEGSGDSLGSGDLGGSPLGNDDRPCCERMEAQPVIYIRAKQTQKAMIVDGKLQIIVNGAAQDDVSPSELSDVAYVSETEFLRQHSAPTSSSNIANTGRPGNKCCDPYHIVDGPNLAEMRSFTHLLDGNGPTDGSSPLSALQTPDSVEAAVPRVLQSGQPKREHSFDEEPLKSGGLVEHREDKNVDVYTHRGIYLSSECSCEDDSCVCINCLIHRNEEELSMYIRQSGVPLTNLSELTKTTKMDEIASCSGPGCKCSPIECDCARCAVHPTELFPFERFYYRGLLNVTLKRKTVIQFQGKLVPSRFWWQFLTVEVPEMADDKRDSLNLHNWFEKLLHKHHSELLSADSDWFLLNDLEGFYVI